MKITQLPAGTKDTLPPEAAELGFLEDSIRDVFALYGYGEVITPTLELKAALDKAEERRFKRCFHLFSEGGDELVLRPEMTTPIARLIATKMAKQEPPFRLCYFANAFRPTTPQRGRRSEFRQAGLEFIGADTQAADAEVLAIVCRGLECCGLKDFSVVLGEVSFLRALLDDIGLNSDERDAVLSALAARDFVKLAEVAGEFGISAEDRQSILDVTSLRGGSEVLSAAKEMTHGEEMDEVLKRLARTYYLVSRYGFDGRIKFDLGILRNFDYYTGIVFEVLSSSLGFPIGGGGRYDGLLAKFGRPLPAVGFAVGLDRLHIAVTEERGAKLPERPGVVLAGGLDLLADLATELRRKSIRVIGAAQEAGQDKLRRLATEAGFPHFVLSEGDRFRLVDTASGYTDVVPREKLAEMLSR